ncbi:MAG TPA: anthrone oxygenase family protein [Kocuria rosea]|nr:anthrone oxygenase family protein [Kocuria rosea]
MAEVLVPMAGLGSALVAGFYVAFSAVVMPALERRPAAEAVSTMVAINEAAVRLPFMALFFGSAAASAATVVAAPIEDDPAVALRVAGAVASLAGWVLTMAVNVPLNTGLARHPPTARAAAWAGYTRAWTRANHLRAASSTIGAVLLLTPV